MLYLIGWIVLLSALVKIFLIKKAVKEEENEDIVDVGMAFVDHSILIIVMNQVMLQEIVLILEDPSVLIVMLILMLQRIAHN